MNTRLKSGGRALSQLLFPSDLETRGDHAIARRYARTIAILSLVLVFGVGGALALMPVSGAVVARGSLVNASYAKKVQHPTGGRVVALNVQEGQKVRAGDVLVSFDSAQIRAALAITESDLLLLEARQRRLQAEQALATGGPGADAVNPRPDDPPDLRIQLASERKLMQARALLRQRQKAQLSEEIKGAQQQISGTRAMSASRQNQLGLFEDELQGVRSLYNDGYAPVSTLKGLERQEEALAGERGQLQANVAEATNRIAEYKMQAAQIDAQHLQEVLTDMRDVENKKAELVQKAAAQRDDLEHVELRAPQDGYVHELVVHTVGAVVGSGEPIMLIVPANDRLTIEARVDPQNITDVSLGQKAQVKFVGLNARATPEIDGVVSRISPDLVQDPRTGASYYVVRVELTRADVARLTNVKLVPGMPAELFIKTADRTLLAYLLKPMTDQLSTAFRER
jgi:HlyD family secretion protein